MPSALPSVVPTPTNWVTSALTTEPETTPEYKPNYAIVDTGQDKYYNNSRVITSPLPGMAFYGQDAQYKGAQPNFHDNGDGTITDLNTGLM